MFKRVTVLAALVLFAFASAANAQVEGAIEIGVDNGFVIALNQDLEDDAGNVIVAGETDWTFDLPLMFWRFGFFINETFAIEPGIGFSYTSFGGDDGGSLMGLNVTADLLYNMPSGLFFSVGGILNYTDIDPGGDLESVSVEVFGFGAGVGYRYPFIADNIRLRFGAKYYYTLENDEDLVPAAHNVLGLIGLSVMTK